MTSTAMPLSLDVILRFLSCNQAPEWNLIWPPDLFAFTSMLLQSSEAYRKVVSPDRDEHWPPTGAWTASVKSAGIAWRQMAPDLTMKNLLLRCDDEQGPGHASLPELPSLPDALRSTFDRFLEWLDLHGEDSPSILVHREHAAARNLLLTLHAIADEASAGLGSLEYRRAQPLADIDLWASLRLRTHGTLSSHHPSRLRVLPKTRSPRVGLSLRSFSQHLAFIRSPVEVRYAVEQISPRLRTHLNCLLLPWPLEVNASDFKAAHHDRLDLDSSRYGFFDFDPQRISAEHLRARLDALLNEAKQHEDLIDLVILPETSLAFPDEIDVLEKVLAEHEVELYIAGVREAAEPGENFGRNAALVRHRVVEGALPYTGYRHYKHHRWSLSHPQIKRYDLQGLGAHKDWWEAIRVEPRSVQFFSATRSISICPLICEDLARQDPVAEIVRSVGPTLVVVLLQDGPQVPQRWGGRYAGALSEDPGCAVLTLTSLGMAILSSKESSKPVPVALWTAPSEREPIPILMNRKAKGLLIRLKRDPQPDRDLADCRLNEQTAPYLVLAKSRDDAKVVKPDVVQLYARKAP